MSRIRVRHFSMFAALCFMAPIVAHAAVRRVRSLATKYAKSPFFRAFSFPFAPFPAFCVTNRRPQCGAFSSSSDASLRCLPLRTAWPSRCLPGGSGGRPLSAISQASLLILISPRGTRSRRGEKFTEKCSLHAKRWPLRKASSNILTGGLLSQCQKC